MSCWVSFKFKHIIFFRCSLDFFSLECIRCVWTALCISFSFYYIIFFSEWMFVCIHVCLFVCFVHFFSSIALEHTCMTFSLSVSLSFVGFLTIILVVIILFCRGVFFGFVCNSILMLKQDDEMFSVLLSPKNSSCRVRVLVSMCFFCSPLRTHIHFYRAYTLMLASFFSGMIGWEIMIPCPKKHSHTHYIHIRTQWLSECVCEFDHHFSSDHDMHPFELYTMYICWM